MRSVWALMVLLLQVFQGVEGYCDARQNNTICYGALGGTMDVRLMDNALEINRCKWRKKSKTIFDWRNNKIVSNELKNRSVFIPENGTYRISDLTRSDSDTYYLEFSDSDGKLTKNLTHQLLIEAPVSSVHLDSQCLSQGEMRVVCTAQGGDSPQYSWTLNGRPLTESQRRSNDSENNITLRQDVEGQLVCSVQNHISHIYKEQNISTCGFIFINCTLLNGTHISEWVFQKNNTLCTAPVTSTAPTVTTAVGNTTSSDQSIPVSPWYNHWPVIVGVVVTTVLIVGVTLGCVKCKKNSKEEEHEQELTYANIRILQQPGRQPQQTTEIEVEYGQVKFSEPRQQIYKESENECVYAKVCKGS